jgi:ATP-dependent RNA helicase DDX18/HAS1
VQALARRSSAQLKRDGTSSTRATTPPRDAYFDDSDDEENSSGRRKSASDPARRARPNGNYRDERTRSAPSLSSVLRQYKGDDDDSGEEAAPGPKVWGKVADATAYRREDRRQKLPLDSGFFSRSSFKEIGCGDEILGALSSFGFPQPSHIQVDTFPFSFAVMKKLLNC